MVSPPEKPCTVQSLTLFFSHLLQVATVTWARGHHPPKNDGASVCLHAGGGTREWVVPSPPSGEVSFPQRIPTSVVKSLEYHGFKCVCVYMMWFGFRFPREVLITQCPSAAVLPMTSTDRTREVILFNQNKLGVSNLFGLCL